MSHVSDDVISHVMSHVTDDVISYLMMQLDGCHASLSFNVAHSMCFPCVIHIGLGPKINGFLSSHMSTYVPSLVTFALKLFELSQQNQLVDGRTDGRTDGRSDGRRMDISPL